MSTVLNHIDVMNEIAKLGEKIDALITMLQPKPPAPVVTQSDYVVWVERKETRNSASPMWKCSTEKGREFHIFQHRDEAKDNTAPFVVHPVVWAKLASMLLYDFIDCANDPLSVELVQEGIFWKCISVMTTFDGWSGVSVQRPYAYQDVPEQE